MSLPPSQKYQELVYPFGNRGAVTKLDPSILQEMQYQRLTNLVSIQEGALRSRNGYQNLTPSGLIGNGGLALDYIHSIGQNYISNTNLSRNYLYLGVADVVYRVTSGADGTTPEIVPSNDTSNSYAGNLRTLYGDYRWTGLAYRKSSSCDPYFYIANSGRMLKDPGTDIVGGNGVTCNEMQRWGIDRPTWPAQAEIGTAPGNLDSIISPYSYVYTLRNPRTGQESNPSPLMFHSDSAAVDKWITTLTPCTIKVTVRNANPEPDYTELVTDTYDPQISGARNIILYRQGGSFADGYYRRVAVLTGLGADVDTEFVDNVPDSEIEANPIAEFDNDRPVVSSLSIPFFATITSCTVLTAGAYAVPGIFGQANIQFTIDQGLLPGETNARRILMPGSMLQFGVGTDHEEFCVIGSVLDAEGPTYEIVTVCQWDHPAGEIISTSSRSNTPCRFACTAFNSIFLAGDSENPNMLYKSKTNQPESFPAVRADADGSPGAIEVGTPADPIMNICEFNGNVLCLNRSHIYMVGVYNNYMQQPVETNAARGLFASYAWCKADNEIYYLGYDGVYSLSGGQSIKRSEAIDPLFKGEFYNGMYPISLDGTTRDDNGFTHLDKILFKYQKNDILISYVDANGSNRRLRYSTLYDRWSQDDIYETASLLEENTGRSLFATVVDGVAILNRDDTPVTPTGADSTDGWTVEISQDDGAAIAWEAWTGWLYMGSPTMQKQFGDMVLELKNSDTAVSVEVYYDFSPYPDETFTVNALDARYRIPLPLNCGLAKEAYAISVRLTGSGKAPTSLHTLAFHFLPLEDTQRGRATDWDNLGWQHDKLLQQLSLEYDVGGSNPTNATLHMDTMSGIAGATRTLEAVTWTLTGTTNTDSSGPTRVRASLPIPANTVAKLIRLRPDVRDKQFKVWEYNFDFIPYPADKVLFTDWSDYGSPYDKYFQQLVLDVDTEGVDASVAVQIDGVTVQTLTVNSTNATRSVVQTLLPSLKGKKARIVATPGVGGKFQLFSHTFIVLPADKGPVYHTYDWDNLGHPYDKRLVTVTIEYEVTEATTMNMDGLSGLSGSQAVSRIITFPLYTGGRYLEQLALPADSIYKMVRFYPESTNIVFKTWKYEFSKIDMPADTVLFTEWTDLGYAEEKLLREMVLDVDTGNVAAKVILQVDGLDKRTFNITTNYLSRHLVVTLNRRDDAELIGRLFRLRVVPGTGGKFQLFDFKLNGIPEPPACTFWDSTEHSFGANGFKIMKQLWLQYRSCSGLTLRVFTDDKQLLLEQELPMHEHRDVERVYLPVQSTNYVFNKSKIYRLTLESCDPCCNFHLYGDETWVEWMPIAADMRTSYRQYYLLQNQGRTVMP